MPAITPSHRPAFGLLAVGIVCVLAVGNTVSAQEILPPPPPGPSLFDFLTGFPIAAMKQDLLKDPLLRQEALKDPLTGKIETDSPKFVAAKIKAQELDAKNNIAAIRYLAKVDCIAHPDAREQLLQQILVKNQPIEPVRYEAGRALNIMLSRGNKKHGPGSDLCNCNECDGERSHEHCNDVLMAALNPPLLTCFNEKMQKDMQILTEENFCTLPLKLPHLLIYHGEIFKLGDLCTGGPLDVCKNGTVESRRQDYCGGCCNADTMKILWEVAYGRDDKCCLLEPSIRVRREALKALELCPCVPGNVTVAPQTGGGGGGVEPPPVPPAEDAEAKRNRQYEQSRMESSADQFASDEIRPPLDALRGYCIVALRDRQFVKANPEFSSVHEGTTYSFSSAEAKQKFDLSPETYALVAAGYDVVDLQKTGQRVAGSLLREHAGRFYLFQNEQHWEDFRGNPLAYGRPAVPTVKQYALAGRTRAEGPQTAPKPVPVPQPATEFSVHVAEGPAFEPSTNAAAEPESGPEVEASFDPTQQPNDAAQQAFEPTYHPNAAPQQSSEPIQQPNAPAQQTIEPTQRSTSAVEPQSLPMVQPRALSQSRQMEPPPGPDEFLLPPMPVDENAEQPAPVQTNNQPTEQPHPKQRDLSPADLQLDVNDGDDRAVDLQLDDEQQHHGRALIETSAELTGRQVVQATLESGEKRSTDSASTLQFDEPVVANSSQVVAFPAGSCIVSFRNGKTLKAHSEFRSTYKGQTYHFANADAKEEFDMFPASYAPAYNGVDPVDLRKSNQARYGRFVMEYGNKLYFFTSEANARLFLQNPDAYRE